MEQRTQLEAMLRRRLSSRSDVADVMQDVVIKIYQMREDTDIDNPRGYLFRTAHNLATDHIRRRRLESAYFVSIEDAPGVEGTHAHAQLGPSPESLAGQRAELRRLGAALAELPAKCREAFLLHRLDGLTYAEIGTRMGVSANMVKKHIVRALLRLREAKVEADAGDPPRALRSPP